MSIQDMQSADLTSFEAIHAYDWAADGEFQAGLQSILSSAPSSEQVATLTLRAKCFFYSKKSGIQINYDVFNAWLARQDPTASAPTETETQSAPEASTIACSNQRDESASILGRPSIDTTDHRVNSENFPASAPSPSTEQKSSGLGSSTLIPEKVQAPYPTTFAHIVELITTGQPIPGIREIPNVLNTAAPSEATKPRRRKPWEAATDSSAGNAAEGMASGTEGIGS